MSSRFWNPDDWQIAINLWLSVRYGLGDYQKVPDKHVGDFGIEGFSTDGNVYQAYAPDAATTTAELFEKQRKKINADIAKFRSNGKDLLQMFGSLKIRRWILIVPSFDSARLVQHAEKRAEEVRQLKLPYVAHDFRIVILDEEAFAAERALVVERGAARAEVHVSEPTAEMLSVWSLTNAEFVETARQKLELVILDTEKREKLIRQLTRFYVKGETAYQRLNATYPAIAAGVLRLKVEREETLEAESLLSVEDTAKDRLTAEVAHFGALLFEGVPGLPLHSSKQLAWGAAAEWIFRCPLTL